MKSAAPKRKPRTFKVWACAHSGPFRPRLVDVRKDKPPEDVLRFYERATLTLSGGKGKGSVRRARDE